MQQASARMEKMKQQVLKTIRRIVDEYGNVSVTELELALIEGIAKLREIGMKQTQEKMRVSSRKRAAMFYGYLKTRKTL